MARVELKKQIIKRVIEPCSELCAEGAMGAFGMMLLGPLLALGYQSFYWLQNGVWPPLTLRTLLGKTVFKSVLSNTWLVEPDSWFGVHKVVAGFLDAPLAETLFFIFIVVGAFLLWLGVAIDKRWNTSQVMPNDEPPQ